MLGETVSNRSVDVFILFYVADSSPTTRASMYYCYLGQVFGIQYLGNSYLTSSNFPEKKQKYKRLCIRA